MRTAVTTTGCGTCDERGSALVVAVIALVVVAGGLVTLGTLRSALLAAARADATADMAALAGAVDGRPAAASVAAANGAELTAISEEAGVTVVRVEREGRTASAAARPVPVVAVPDPSRATVDLPIGSPG